ncbi:MAG: CHAD domain-containing protein [Bryobacterales bacterium]|nr:CHAD domain-containing protein [Bryobacterales bacterium]
MARKRIRWDARDSVADNAARFLPAMAADFFQAGRKAVAARSAARLHEFRLDAKRFRYTLELFRGCYGPGLARRLESLREIQQRLGDMNDCATVRTLLDGAPRLEDFFRYLEERASGTAAGFRAYWRETFDRPGEEKRWTAYLRRYAGRAGGK